MIISNRLRPAKGIFILLLVSLISACSEVPDVQKIGEIFSQHKLNDGYAELFSIEGFKKINGFQKSKNIYLVDIEYDLVFKKNLSDVLIEISEDPVGPQYGVFGSKFIAYSIQSNFGNFKAGDRLGQKEKITLIKTEQGWQIDPG